MKIYYAKIASLCEEVSISEAMQLLPAIRLEKINKMKQKADQMRSVAAGLLLEYGLREYGLTGKQVTFLEQKDGKPYILEHPELHYNLTHSGDYVALAIGGQAVGIDMEHLRENQMRLVKRFFAEDECQMLMNHWSDAAFTRMWTRKESYIKAAGFGMRMPLDGFSTVESRVLINEKMNPEMIEDGAVYYLESYPVGGDYWLSVCRKNSPVCGEPLEIRNINERILWD